MAVQIICRIVGGAKMRHMLVQNQIAHGKLLRLQFCIRLIPDLLRCCAGERLHLVKPLGFDISDRAVKRAGLDYWHLVDISVYENIDEYFAKNGDENLWLLTTKASVSYVDADLSTPNVTLMFGKETKGLPEWLRERYADHCLRIPMRAVARSLNLSNTAAILCYEALRQQNMLGQIDLNV